MDLTAQQQQTYRFPLLKNNEILQIMSELDIKITEEELNEPARHRDTVRNAFIQLVSFKLLSFSFGLLYHPWRCIAQQRHIYTRMLSIVRLIEY
jgi:hypothetical protein